MPWEMPWITSETLKDQRLSEELLKRGGGDRKINFEIPLHWVGEFDVFSNFRLQDLFAISSGGTGERGGYYFIELISYDFDSEKLVITAVDMQWLLRQYFTLNDDTISGLNTNWADATDDEKMYGYLCDEVTGAFENGEEGKRLMSEEV